MKKSELPVEPKPSEIPKDQYRPGESTYYHLHDRLGNNLASVETMLRNKQITAEEANQNRITFMNTLRRVVTEKAREERGVTHKKLNELINIVSLQDWSKMDDVAEAMRKSSELLSAG